MIDSVNLEKDAITWVCNHCQVDHSYPVSGLTLGTDEGPDVIPLPVCVCGTREFLFRTWDGPTFPWRGVINSLAQHLVSVGQVSPDVRQPDGIPELLAPLPAKDLTGRAKAHAVRRHGLIVEATTAAVVRLGLAQGERPSVDEVTKDYVRLLETL